MNAGWCIRWLIILCLASAPPEVFGQSEPAAPVGLHHVVFTEYSPLTRTPEFLQRVLSPLAAQAIQHELTDPDKPVAEQSVDLSKEEFVIYVPSHAPANGYALMVFVPPWREATLPSGWARVLDQYGFIFVSAARSGNDENLMARREPLALLEVQNVVKRYNVDPGHIFVGGFSGGSRVAQRLALDYPDVFHGAFLNAGSDPIGVSPVPLPSKDLLFRFQESSRIVYVTGARDFAHLSMDAASSRSMLKQCVYGIDAHSTPGLAHEIADSRALSEALKSLLEEVPPEPARLVACRATVRQELERKLKKVETLIANHRRSAARDLILNIDSSFGGLAAPRIIELAQKCDCDILR
jgi:predicted esterase